MAFHELRQYQVKPVSDKSTVLSRRNMVAVMKAAWKHETACKHLRRPDPSQNSFTCVFRQFELNRSLGFTLDHENKFLNPIILHEIGNREYDEVASAQLAVDGDVEQSQVAKIARKFESRPDRPNLLGQQWSFLSDDPPIVPSSAFWGDGG